MKDSKCDKGVVAHLTSVHSRNDTRIFLKQCRTLVRARYEVSLIVADGQGNESRDGVRIYDVGMSRGRLNRMMSTTRRVFQKACELNASVYHLHDPELIPIGLLLKRRNKRVIFDSHEDVPKQLLGKHYLNSITKGILSKTYELFEFVACRRFDAIIAATPYIRDKFSEFNHNTVNINNFPMLGELEVESDWAMKKRQVCYVGGIGSIRGIREMVRAMDLVKSDSRLQLGGIFTENSLKNELKKNPGWRRIEELGFLDRESVRALLARSMAGLVTFLPSPNHLEAQPNKMFEYMSAGVPVIASHFPLWRAIIEGNECGLCVDPLNSRAIAAAIDCLITDSTRAEQMGRNGHNAVREKFNWDREAEKFLRIYELVAQ